MKIKIEIVFWNDEADPMSLDWVKRLNPIPGTNQIRTAIVEIDESELYNLIREAPGGKAWVETSGEIPYMWITKYHSFSQR